MATALPRRPARRLLRGQAGRAPFGARRGATCRMHLAWATSRASTLSATLEWRSLGFPVRYGKFLRLESRDRSPDHSWLSRTRARLPDEVDTAIFDAGSGAVGVSRRVLAGRASPSWGPMPGRPWRRCNAASAQHRVTEGHGRGLPGDWRAWPRRAASRPPTAEDLARLDRKRKGNQALEPGLASRRATPEAVKIAKMKDGTKPIWRLQDRARGLGWNRGRWWPPNTPGRRGRHDDAGEDAWRRPRAESRGWWTRHRRPKTRPNV